MQAKHITIDGEKIGDNYPVYIIAELSGNHLQDFNRAKVMIRKAKECRVNAIKMQTYTPDTITMNCDNEYFQIKENNTWSGRTLYQLYQEAQTPWEWHEELFNYGKELGITMFSSPFDLTAVDFLEDLNVPAYKIASFELTDIELVKKIAKTGKPIIMSIGLSSLAEIDETVSIIKDNGNDLAILHCVSSYPAPASEMNIRTIPHLKETFQVPVGLSDHHLGNEIAIASIALGANIIEKHFILDRKLKGPDAQFSLEPEELLSLVRSIRTVEEGLGDIKYGTAGKEEEKNKIFRRSIFAIKDIKKGDYFTSDNVKIIRPSYGLKPRFWNILLGKKATKEIKHGSPISWDMLSIE